MKASARILILLGLPAWFILSASTAYLVSQPRVVSYASLTRAGMDSIVVARVGNHPITAKEFMLSYEYGPAFVKRQENSKLRYLELMINEKLLALDGYSAGLDSSTQLRQTLDEIEGDLATEELYKDDVLSKVSVSEREIQTGVHRERQHITLKWLYAHSYEQMVALQNQLRNQVPFDSLFQQQMGDSVAMEDRMLETTRFRLENKNAALSSIADTLRMNQVSAPIYAPDGWYIVKMVQIWTNPIMTESEQMKLRYEVQRALFKRKADALSDEYVRNLMLEQNPVIKRTAFNLLQALLARQRLSPEKYAAWRMQDKIMAESGPINLDHFDEFKDTPLVKLSQSSIQLREFMQWFNARKDYIRLPTTNSRAFSRRVEQLVWRMTRDKLLRQRAFRRGLQNRETVKTQKKWWRDKIAFALRKLQLARDIEMSPAKLRQYYEKNKHRYSNRHHQVPPFSKVEAEIRRDYFSQVMSEKLYHRLVALKRKYPVILYKKALAKLKVDIEHDPRAVDFYTVKKGGIFPRPAFPTIDFDWKILYN